MCGRCHIRGDAEKIPASKGFIRHHEQFNELMAGPHKVFDCTTCHLPHKHSSFKGAIKIPCESCHSKQAADFAGSRMQLRGVTCANCHMPEATKSAINRTKFQGDVKTHIFKINLDPKAQMFTKDGKFANDFITVEYACLSCHGEKDRKWSIETASKGIHSYGKN